MSLRSFCKKVTEKLVSDYKSTTKRHELLHCLIVAIRVEGVNVVFTFDQGIVYVLLSERKVVLGTV